MRWERKKPAVMPLPPNFIKQESSDEEIGRKLLEAPVDIQPLPTAV